MNASRILNQSQAEAVYSAMCALNNVSGRIDVKFDSSRAFEQFNGAVIVCSAFDRQDETYDNQNAFATAYGLSAPKAITAPLKDGDPYWVAFPLTNDVGAAVWGEGDADEQRLEEGRCYRTEAEARAAAKA